MRAMFGGMMAMLIATPAIAQQAPPERITAITVFGDEACPEAAGDEIVVCAREDESERFRVPKAFRGLAPDAAGNNAWANRFKTLEVASRVGLPNSCSPTGTGGQTGCLVDFIGENAAERARMRAAAEAWRR